MGHKPHLVFFSNVFNVYVCTWTFVHVQVCACVFIYVPRPEDNLRHYPQVSNPPSWGWGLFLAQRSPIRLGWQVSEPQRSSGLHPSSPGVTSLYHHAQHSYMGAGNQMQIFTLAKRVLDRLHHSSYPHFALKHTPNRQSKSPAWSFSFLKESPRSR